MLNPTIPKNVEAEIALLGCIFVDQNLIVSALDQLEASDFYESKNKEIYKAMQALYNQKQNIDITTMQAYLNNNDKLSQVGGIEYVASIISSSYSTAGFDSYIELIRSSALKRKYIDKLNSLVQKGYDGKITINDYIDSVEKEVFELSTNKRTGELTHIKNVVEEVKKTTNLRSKSNSEITGLDTGFSTLNKVTLGFQKDALIIIAARPSMGKSAFAMNLAVNVAKNNKDGKANVAVFSLEMSSEQLVERMISSESFIESDKIKKGKLSGDEGMRFNVAGASLAGLNIYFDDASNISVEDIRTKCRKLKADNDLDIVIIDYLQLIKGDSSKSKNEEIGMISRSLKLMARELHIPVIALAQLSREVEKTEDKKPMMSHLRDSGSIEQDADVIMFIYREDYYKKKDSTRPGEADIIIAKNRSGSVGDELPFIFQGPVSKFIPLDPNRKSESNQNGKEE